MEHRFSGSVGISVMGRLTVANGKNVYFVARPCRADGWITHAHRPTRTGYCAETFVAPVILSVCGKSIEEW